MLNASAFADAKIKTEDGCRIDFADDWIHLRASNTEPVIRVIAEAKEQQTAQEYIRIIQTKALVH